MRIAYGVFGYGRGHATRAAAVLSDLARAHDLLIIAGGDAYEQLSLNFSIVKIPTLGYAYAANAKRSNYRTLRQNAWHVLDIFFRGPVSQQISAALADFKPDVVISDAEPWTHQAARRMRVPRIGFDHFGLMANCKPPLPFLDRFRSMRDVFVYRTLMGSPERVIVSSFYDAPPRRAGVRVIGPLLRPEIHQFAPVYGERLLCYFNKGQYQFTRGVERALSELGIPTLIYGTERRGVVGTLDFRPPSNLPFVEDLARCRALISTAGNQLIGEALHYRKPVLVMPEDCVEQRMNAAAVERLGIGMQTTLEQFSSRVLLQFLAREDDFRAQTHVHARDGRAEALAVIEQFVTELTLGSAVKAAHSQVGSESCAR